MEPSPTPTSTTPVSAMDFPARASTPTSDQQMVSSQTRKRNADASNIGAGSEGEDEVDWIPEKVRAIAGPNQMQLDQIRHYGKQLEERILTLETENRALNLHIEDTRKAYEEEIESREVDEAVQIDRLSRMERDNSHMSDQNGYLFQRISDLERKYETSLTNFENMKNTFETRIQSMINENLVQLDSIKNLQAERDDAIRDKEVVESENHCLRKKGKQKRGVRLEGQAFADDAHADDEMDGPASAESARSPHSAPPPPPPSSTPLNQSAPPPSPPSTGSAPTSTTNQSTPTQPTPMMTDLASMIHAATKAAISEHMGSARTTPGATPRRTHRKAQSPKQGSRTYDRKLKLNAFATMSNDDENGWKSYFRSRYLEFTQMSKISQFQEYKSIGNATADDFAQGEGPGPSERDGTLYRLFLGEGWRAAAWNRVVVDNMARIIHTDAIADGLKETCITVDVVKATLWDYILQARNSWSAATPRVHKNGGRFETPSEAKVRNADQQKTRAQATRSNTRKKAKHDERSAGVRDLLRSPLTSPLQRNKWEMVSHLVKLLDIEGQSSENTDSEDEAIPNQPPSLLVKVPYFRRRVISEYMEQLDNAIDTLRVQEARQAGKRFVSRPSRVRKRITSVSRRTVKHNLPKSCYHRRYLKTLIPSALAIVQPRDETIPLFSDWADRMNSDTEMDET